MTMTFTHKPVVLSAFALVMLMACSGGGGGVIDPPVDGGDPPVDGGDPPVVLAPFGDAASTEAADLIALSLDANAGTVTNETGTLNRTGNTIAFGSIDGTISDDRTGVDLTNGAVTFDGDADAFAVRFDAAQGTTNTLGVIGVAADPATLPSGTATYTGDTVITAQSGTDLFELDGTATITANFGAGTPNVTTALTALSGTRQPAAAAIEDVADAGSLTITGSTISGSGFSGGTATLDSTVLSLSGSETTALEGAFYGTDGAEAGGVFIIEDGTTRIFGDFLGD